MYGLKQASRQWYLKFDEIMKRFNFIKNPIKQCIYTLRTVGEISQS